MSTESPISITYSLVDPNGFDVLMTFRSDEPAKLMVTLKEKSDFLKDNGYKAKPQRTFGAGVSKPPAEVVPDRKCPICGSNLIYATTKEGKKFIKCSTNKWNFQTKQSEGCTYTDWGDAPRIPPSELPHSSDAVVEVKVEAKHSKCPECGAPTIEKSGIAKSGKPYHGYFCSADRNHKPQFIYVEVAKTPIEAEIDPKAVDEMPF